MKNNKSHENRFPRMLFYIFFVVLSFGGLLPLVLFYFSSFFEYLFSGNLSGMAQDFSDRGLFGFSPIILLLVSYLILSKIKDAKVFFVSVFFVAACSFWITFNATGINFSDIRTQILSILYFLLISFTVTLVWKRVYFLNDRNFSYLLLIPVGIMITLGLFVDDFMFHQYILFANYVNQSASGYYFNVLQLDYIGFVITASTLSACVVSIALCFIRDSMTKRDAETSSA